MNRQVLLSVAAVLAAGAACRAQSFNITFSPSGVPEPSPSYGAAGPAGFWNVISAPSSDHLRALDGSLTNVPNFATQAMLPTTDVLPGPTGDDAALLNSFIPLIDIFVNVTITGLENGNYNVFFYGLNSGNISTSWQISPNFEHVSGGWTGQLEVGHTHVMMPATVTDGSLTFGMVGSIIGTAHFAGMQIVQVPAPGSAVCLLGAGCLLARRRR